MTDGPDFVKCALVVVSQQVILRQPGHRSVSFDAEVRPVVVVMVKERREAFQPF